VVAGRDLPLAAQARPGTRLRFRFVSVEAARGARG
jgi:allophanate hydrolase subunit 2